MKTQLVKLIPKVALLSAMLIFTSAATTHAQSLANRPRFNVPFDFVFGEKKFAAGKYSIGRTVNGSDDTMMSIADNDGRSKAVLLSNAVIKTRAQTKALLVFHRYGDQYFLVQVWAAGATTGRQFPQSKSERDVQKQLASNGSANKVALNTKSDTVIIAAN
ncbi:MAG TPA: hypothetical protein VHQ94_06890 [Pyrinomonadaceae bacterium]|jgi:hypothetical protein|nr:hypothetical protein [Pyrinomonadaceae bacterium]